MIPHGTFEIPDKPSQKLPAGPLKVMAFGKFGTYKKVESMIKAIEIVRKEIYEKQKKNYNKKNYNIINSFKRIFLLSYNKGNEKIPRRRS